MPGTDAEHDPGPFLLRRRLADKLHRLREEKGLTLDQVARELEFSASKLSRIETCQVTAAMSDVRAMLDLYKVGAVEREELLEMARQARRREDTWRDYKRAPNVLKLMRLEEAASTIYVYHSVAIPGLFQVEDYARGMLRVVLPDLSHDEIEHQVRLRMQRQSLLYRMNPPRIRVVLDEAAIRRLEGQPHVLGEQLRRLIQVMRMENVQIQLIPFARGLHGGIAGAFRILTFPHPEDLDQVHLEQSSGNIYLRSPHQVAPYHAMFERLSTLALTSEESADFLRGIERAAPNDRQ
jgi:transcriptional regulator with XRE-family HTH domain